ncbi:MAG: hypothetical protein ACLPZY_00540 [Terracidiphilus sp.]
MVVVPLAKPQENAIQPPASKSCNDVQWLRYAAAGTLAASGALLVTGYRRAGLIAAASGVALAMLDQQDVVRAWWNMLPGFLEEMHTTLGKAQTAVEDLSTQGQKLSDLLCR